MERWTASAAGGTSQRLKPGPATVRSRSKNDIQNPAESLFCTDACLGNQLKLHLSIFFLLATGNSGESCFAERRSRDQRVRNLQYTAAPRAALGSGKSYSAPPHLGHRAARAQSRSGHQRFCDRRRSTCSPVIEPGGNAFTEFS